MEEHKYIKVLKAVESKGELTKKELEDILKGKGLRQLTKPTSLGAVLEGDSTDGGPYRLSFEGEMKLLEYKQLEEARQSAKDAKDQAHTALTQAKIAMGISAILAVASIILGVYGQFFSGPTMVAFTKSQMEGIMSGLREARPPSPPYEVTLIQDQLDELKSALVSPAPETPAPPPPE